ncbi:MAG TPA: hypothetical protein DDW36_04010 [Candidatus Magasanikbacteria bacterium]|nr:hypothetical protein [Candidatus Magasanikbacteria bacterium]
MLTVVFIIILVLLFTFSYAGLRGAPWVPTKNNDMARFLRLANIQPGEKMYDLGCGDGRMVCAAGSAGAQAKGFEVSVFPFLIAKLRRLLQKNKKNISIAFRDFWFINLRDADVVYVFLMPKIYERLEEKFKKELRPGARVITYVWPLEAWQPQEISEEKGFPKMYSYIVPQH